LNAGELFEYSRMIARIFAGRGLARDLVDDAQQLAAVSVLETERRYCLPLKGNRAFYYRGAFLETAGALTRLRAACTMGENTADKIGGTFFDRTPLVGCGGAGEQGAVEVEDDRRPDAAMRAEEVARARLKLLDLFEDHLAAMTEDGRRALKMLFGIGTPQRDVDEVLHLMGVHRNTLNAWLRRFGASVRRDRGARRARRIYVQAQEAA
jgi:hypothetical protein